MDDRHIPGAIAGAVADLPDGLGITNVFSQIPFQKLWNFSWKVMGLGLSWNPQDNQRSVSYSGATAIVYLWPARLIFEITPLRVSFYLVDEITDRAVHCAESIHIHAPGGEMDVGGCSEFPIVGQDLQWLFQWQSEAPQGYILRDYQPKS
jgi:hypothetical protein